MHEIVKYFILTEIHYEIVNFRSRSDRDNLSRDLAHSRCMEQCMVADLSAGLGQSEQGGVRLLKSSPPGQSTQSIQRVQ